jgi:hypothetical protein
MDERKVIVTCLIVVIVSVGVILGGFAYAYINKLNSLNQTKSYFQSLGYDVYILTFTTPAFTAILPIADVASFISIARQNNATTILEIGYHFYFFTVSGTAYEYTPNNSMWWIWE